MKNSGGPKQKNKSCVNSILIWSMSTWQFIPLEQMSFSWEQAIWVNEDSLSTL